jgi:alpha-glucuronidase
MSISRREFLATSALIAAAAAVPAGCDLINSITPEPSGEDGYDLWLRYRKNPGRIRLGPIEVRPIPGSSAGTLTSVAIQTELLRFRRESDPNADPNGDPNGLPVYVGRSDLIPDADIEALRARGPEGFILRSVTVNNRLAVAIRGAGGIGSLYGAFHLIRLLQTHQPVDRLNITQAPRLQLRLANHWDNLEGSIERGYAGRSLWNWDELPGKVSSRLTDYARASASIGLNGAVLNNVNASARILTPEYLAKVAAIAGAFRPYGVRVYLSANCAAPKTIGGLSDADPLNPAVIDWWKKKADEIYGLIPDFGGFLVKANSEGQPGPREYGRSHAQGANTLADALAPHRGNVIWRAFIYDEDVDPDRAKRAYLEFTALEGQFRPNVIIQVKNGAIDFMPREPFHPLFGALPKTPVMAEIQPTQEYLGQTKHLVYLGTMWKEFLDADTYAKGPGSTVGKVLEGKVHPYAITGMAGVLNPGTDANWCGHHFSQANWYAFGRLCWDYQLSAEQIAREWVAQTFTHDPAATNTIVDMMMSSREAFVDYTMPLGLHHLIGGDHYAPMPENDTAPRRDWTATYYHQASKEAIGFDRTRRGDKAVDQYFKPVADVFDDVNLCPEMFLLWFHRLPWDHRMKSGNTLRDELVLHYYRGARQAAAFTNTWQRLSPYIDARRHQAVAARLAIQKDHAAAWRDKCLTYFAQFSNLPING